MDRVTLEALSGYFPDGKFARRVQPLPEHGCIYVRNAKAASLPLRTLSRLGPT